MHLNPSDSSQVLDALKQRIASHFAHTQRPFVTVTYAQSLDGSITNRPGEPMAISGPESLVLTHQLRALHAGILVGIGTILSDNPALTTRLCDGEDAVPVILDSTLRIPPNARVLEGAHGPIIATTSACDPAKKSVLAKRGARVYELPADEWGLVSIPVLLECLGQMGIHSLMVEGGGRVITRFIDTAMVDRFVITMAFMLVGGVPVLSKALRPTFQTLSHGDKPPAAYPRLRDVELYWAGQDLILHADPEWET